MPAFRFEIVNIAKNAFLRYNFRQLQMFEQPTLGQVWTNLTNALRQTLQGSEDFANRKDAISRYLGLMIHEGLRHRVVRQAETFMTKRARFSCMTRIIA
jgi:hypothetical protein